MRTSLSLMLLAVILGPQTTLAQHTWQTFKERGSRVVGHVDTSTTPPDVVRVFSEATLGEPFLWTAWNILLSDEERMYQCSEAVYLGVLNNSLVIRTKRYSSTLVREGGVGSVMRGDLLKKLPILESERSWKTYAEQATSACAWGEPNGEETNVVYVPLRDGVALVSLPAIRGKGDMLLNFTTIGATLDVRFEPYKVEEKSRQQKK